MKKIELKDLNDNFFEAISKEWMLVTAGSKDKFNTMTASWGGTGELWLSFLGYENKDIHKICGSKSGRDIDKIAATGLRPVFTEQGNVLYEQSRLSLECRKLYTDTIKESCFIDKSLLGRWYGEGHGGLHHMYIGEIQNAWLRE